MDSETKNSSRRSQSHGLVIPAFSRSFAYLVIALIVGALAIGVDLQAIIQTQTELNYAVIDELTPKQAVVTKSEADTSSWKTYRNEEYGFEFKYPGDGVVERDNSRETEIQNFDSENHGYSLLENEYSIRITYSHYLDDGRRYLVDCSRLKGEKMVIGGKEVYVGTWFNDMYGETNEVLCAPDIRLQVGYMSNNLGPRIVSTFKFTK